MNNTNIIGPKVSSRRFDFSKKSGEFVAEMAELQHGGVNILGRLYADSADTGFVMVSEKTGKEIEFTLKEVARDADRDIQFWEFEPTFYAKRSNPALEQVRVIVLND